MLAPLLLGSVVFVLLVAYQLARPRLRCEPIDERPVVLLRGRIVGPKATGEVVCRVDDEGRQSGIGQAELPLVVDSAKTRILVLARGAVVSASWPHRGAYLRVGDRIAVAGALGDLQREEALYRESGCAFGLEALRIVVGGLPPIRGLNVALCGAGALVLACLLLLLSPLGKHEVSMVGLPCPAGTRLEGRPPVLGSKEWTQVCLDAHGREQGPVVRWSAGGIHLKEGTYVNGRLHGRWSSWWASGRQELEGGYRQGRRHGLWRRWAYDGTPSARGRYRWGLKEGRWTVWGDVCRDWGGHAPSSTNYPRRLAKLGEIRQMRCTYRAGRLHGPFTLWLASGIRLDGALWSPPAPRGSTFDPAPSAYHGRWIWRNAAGVELLESEYRDGIPVGRWIRRSAAGRRLLEGRYRAQEGEPRMSGRWTRYRPDGSVAWACTFADGLAAGWLPPCRQERYRCRDLSARCDARLAYVRPHRPLVRGALSRREVEQAVYPLLEEFWYPCSPGRGKVTVALQIGRGEVLSARVRRSTYDSEANACIIGVLSRLAVRATVATTRVSYTLEFRPSERKPLEVLPPLSDDCGCVPCD